MSALDLAIEVCGGPPAFASAIGVRPSTPFMWKARQRVPAEHCPAIERETKRRGKPVPCERLRPDVPWSVLREQVA
jgi:DNA-binding transcriptional regulator YdaS (Cro superfamily)